VGKTSWNPNDISGLTLSNNNFTAAASAAGPQSVRSTTSQTSGKYCFDIVATAITPNWDAGLASSNFVLNVGGGLGIDTNGIGFDPNSAGGFQGVFYNNALLNSGASSSPSGEAESFCADLGAGLLWVSNATQRAAGNTWNNSPTANPATGVGGISFTGLTGPYFIIFNSGDAGASATLNAAGPLAVTLPTGFSYWQPPVVTTGGRPFVLIMGANDNVPSYANDNSEPSLAINLN
jgi:hypothetical protein